MMLLLYTRLSGRNRTHSEFNKQEIDREQKPSHHLSQDNTTQQICQVRQAYYLERRLIL